MRDVKGGIAGKRMRLMALGGEVICICVYTNKNGNISIF